MGVSFDVPDYFDNIYAYGCSNSLGAQEFCQMLHRVRKPKDTTIYLALDYYKEHQSEDLITYSSVEYMLCSDYYLTNYDLHNNLLYKKLERIGHSEPESDALDSTSLVKDKDTSMSTTGVKMLSYPYKEEPIYDLYVRNSKEVVENKMNFARQFFGYAKFKENQI